MANTKISQLPAATTLTAADLIPVVQGGVTKQVTPDLLPISTAATAALAGKDAVGAAAAAQATAIQRANHTGTQTADTIVDGTTNKAYTGTERTKLAGIATAATANRADAAVDTLLAAKADLIGGVIPTAQIPAIALTNAVTVASQAAMLALTTTQVQPGDVAVRTDGAGTFILTVTDPTVLGNWVRLNAPTDAVTTVNGQSGTVVLAKTDIGLGNVDNTADINKPVSTAQATAIGARLAAASNLSDLANAGTARTNLGLGTAAVQPASAFDAAGTATAAQAAAVTSARRITPTAAAAGAANFYNPATNAYNVTPKNLLAYRTSRAASVAGLGLCRVAMLGDSTYATPGGGAGPSSGVRGVNDIAIQIRKRMAALGFPIAGTGMVTAMAQGGAGLDSRWAVDSNWTLNVPYTQAAATGATATFTSDLPGTIATLWFYGYSGPFTLTIDGATPATGSTTATHATYSAGIVTPSGGGDWCSVQVTGLANTTHAVKIVTNNSNTFFLQGAEVRNATGWCIDNWGVSGAPSLPWDSNNFAGYLYPALQIPASLYLINLTINDFNNSLPVATHKSQILGIAGLLPTTASVAYVQPAAIGNPTANLTLPPYVQADYQIADQLGIPLLDLNDRWVDWVTANAAALMYDGDHPNVTGYTDQALAHVNALLAA